MFSLVSRVAARLHVITLLAGGVLLCSACCSGRLAGGAAFLASVLVEANNLYIPLNYP